MKQLTRNHTWLAIAFVAVLLAASTAIAVIASGIESAQTADAEADSITGMMQEAPDAVAQSLQGDAQQSTVPQPQADATQTSAADDCSVTINYLEYADYSDPDAVYDDMGRRVLGSRTITGLHEGDQLNAWDYVVDLPGHFFFDGWPLNMTVSADPAQNVFDLIYIKLYDSEYTVNYYMMTGADLTATTWSGALAPDDVEFYKLGSETFDNQRFDALIEGDAYEYKLDDMYVIDTYPAQIRLGTDPDNNVINVLYTPSTTSLPDGIEVPDEVTVPDETETPTLPDDETMDYDHLISLLPDSYLIPQGVDNTTMEDIIGSDIKEDFGGSDIDRGEQQITDEMLDNPVSKEQAELTIKAYQTGLEQGANADTGDKMLPVIATLAGIALVALVVAIVLFARNRKSRQE